MGSIIIKPERDVDFYVHWSTTVDGPLCWGDKEEVFGYLLEGDQKKEEFARPAIEMRFARADSWGSSAHGYRLGHWEDSGIMYEQRGFLRREDIRKFLDSWDEEIDSFDYSILKPLDL
jgi:hypothetical protein